MPLIGHILGLMKCLDARMYLNEDVPEFVALRPAASAKYNVLGDDLCDGEAINIWVSAANSMPALFWTLT